MSRYFLMNQTMRLLLSRAQIAYLQEKRLRDMLAYAKTHSPWYQERLKHIDPFQMTLNALNDIPIMNKKDVMEHWNDIVTDRRLSIEEAGAFLMTEQGYDLYNGHHIFASGGSSGRRGMFVWDSNEIALTLASLYQYQLRDEFCDSMCYSKEPLMVASIGALRPVHLSETVLSFPVVPNMQARAFSALAPIDDLVNDLNDCQPTHLNGYPSVIARLALKATKGQLKINPRRILVGAEPLLPLMIESIHKAWPDVKLINNWGSTDAGIHAVSCDYSNGHLHLCEDMVIIEPVDEQYNPVEVGQRSEKILITNLFRKSMPVFRYEMDDRIVLLRETCPCGSQFQLISSVEGRHEDDFVYGQVIVIAEVFENAIMVDSGVDEYQVIQTKNGAEVLIVPDRESSISSEKMKKDLEYQLQQLGLSNPTIEIKLVEHLKRHEETGKLKRFKCL